MIKIEGHHNLYKSSSGAVINIDKKAYQKAVERKKEKQKMNQIEERLDKIEKLLERLLDAK